MKGKRGSHVGVILSFVIFITFIVFLYTVIRPIVTTGEDKQTTLEYIESKIIENVSTNFTKISIKIDNAQNPSQYCIQLEKFFVYSMVPAYLIVKNENEEIQDAYYNLATDFDNLRINREDRENTFFKIYYSPKFSKLPTTAISPCSLVSYIYEYNITSINKNKYIFEGSMYELVNYYKNNYEKLKDEFNIPPGSEFGFSFIQSNKTKIEVGNASKAVSVYAGEVPVQYIDSNANILSGFINVKVW